MAKKTNFGPNFDLFGPNLDPKFFLRVLPLLVIRQRSKLSYYANSRKTAKLEKMTKNLIPSPILAHLVQI